MHRLISRALTGIVLCVRARGCHCPLVVYATVTVLQHVDDATMNRVRTRGTARPKSQVTAFIPQQSPLKKTPRGRTVPDLSLVSLDQIPENRPNLQPTPALTPLTTALYRHSC